MQLPASRQPWTCCEPSALLFSSSTAVLIQKFGENVIGIVKQCMSRSPLIYSLNELTAKISEGIAKAQCTDTANGTCYKLPHTVRASYM